MIDNKLTKYMPQTKFLRGGNFRKTCLLERVLTDGWVSDVPLVHAPETTATTSLSLTGRGVTRNLRV